MVYCYAMLFIIILCIYNSIYITEHFQNNKEYYTKYYNKKFPDNRLSDKTELRQSQNVMTRMMKIFHDICIRNNIKYWLIDGSLLGTIRHKGWIPWDGDIDIGMLKKDYDKFVEIGSKELSDDIFFQTPETDKLYKSNIPKLRDKYSSYYQYQKNHPNQKWHHGLQVDIFVFKQNDNKLVHPTSNKFTYNMNDILPPKLHKFEDTQFYIPSNPHKYLTKRYNNKYMEYPPKNKRFPHEGKCSPIKPCNHTEILHWK